MLAKCRSRHSATLADACSRKANAKAKAFCNFFVPKSLADILAGISCLLVATITVDSDEVERFGHNGYIVMVWNKFFGPSRVVGDNQEFLVNYSEVCPCLSLLKGEQYLISGNVTNQRLSINDDSLIMPYTSYPDLQAAINADSNCS